MVWNLLRRLKLSKTEFAVILGGVYIFLQVSGNIAASKLTYFGPLIMDAGFIYAITFTWRDLIHKQLGKRAAQVAILLAGAINLLMALYFQLVIVLPAQPEWATAGGQAAWQFIFGIVPRIVLASIISEIISELMDTEAYQWWTEGWGRNKPQWMRVAVSNAVSVPMDSIIFPIIAFSGIVSAGSLVQMFFSNILVKAIVTVLTLWMIYLVPEKPIYVPEKKGIGS